VNFRRISLTLVFSISPPLTRRRRKRRRRSRTRGERKEIISQTLNRQIKNPSRKKKKKKKFTICGEKPNLGIQFPPLSLYI